MALGPHNWIAVEERLECQRCQIRWSAELAHELCPTPMVLRHDPVNSPRHYTSHPSGVECIDIVEHFDFCIGNAIKYAWRAGLKGDALEDLKKARWYMDRAISRLEKVKKP
jgi:hypothetical protein